MVELNFIFEKFGLLEIPGFSPMEEPNISIMAFPERVFEPFQISAIAIILAKADPEEFSAIVSSEILQNLKEVSSASPISFPKFPSDDFLLNSLRLEPTISIRVLLELWEPYMKNFASDEEKEEKTDQNTESLKLRNRSGINGSTSEFF
jgi:hypothetical protein